MKTKRLFVIHAITAFLFVALFSATQVSAQGITVYNNIPSPLPGNLVSLGYEATSTSEFGDRIKFSTGSGGNLLTATVTLSSWGCENGTWNSANCSTTPGATFSHPITLKIYNVGNGITPGALIGSVTQTFAIPYRPSSDPSCPAGGKAWKDGDGNCWNGLATNVTFDLSSLPNVPNEVIFGIAYNTTHYGYAPIGEAASCFSEPGGCGYDSLNVAVADSITVGANSDPDDAYANSSWAGFYCDGGTNGVGIFRRDAPSGNCNWTGYQPAVKFTISNAPTNANQCKNNGWKALTRENGTFFKNQGDCIQYVNTGK